MDLVIAEQEYNDTAQRIADTAKELVRISNAYVACLQGVKASGYRSSASATAIDNRCSKVGKATQALASAVESLSASTKGHLETIGRIDRAVF